MARCFGDGDPLYAAYHDQEWGRPPKTFGRNESYLFERLTLEVFQVGLSWLLILRRRAAFRESFANFDPYTVAAFNHHQVKELTHNSGIIRNRAKIEATINNAHCVAAMHKRGESLAELFARHRPQRVVTRRASYEDLPQFIPQAQNLAKELKKLGFKFVGPTNVYAMMQATGLVDDHLATCPIGQKLGDQRDRDNDIWDGIAPQSQ